MKSEVERAVTAIRKHYSPLTVEVFESFVEAPTTWFMT